MMKRRSGNEAFSHISASSSRNQSREPSIRSNNQQQQQQRTAVHFDTNRPNPFDNNQQNRPSTPVLALHEEEENTFSVQAAGDPRLHTVISEFGNVRGLSKVLRPVSTTTTSSGAASFIEEVVVGNAANTNENILNNSTSASLPVAWCADTDGSITVRRGDDPTRVLIRIPKKDSGQFATCIAQVGEHQVWAGYSDGCIRVYDVKTGLLLEELWHHEGAVCCLVVGSDGLVYSGAQDWKVYQWDPKARTFLRLFFGHANSVRCMVTAQGNPWRSVFMSHRRRRTAEIALYHQQVSQEQPQDNSENGREHQHHNNHQQHQTPSRSFAPSPITREAKLQNQNQQRLGVGGAGLHLSLPKRAVLFSGSDDGTIRVWDALAPRQHTKDVACLHTFSGEHTKGVHTLLLHFDTMTLWSGGEDAAVVVWDLESCNCLTNIPDVHSAPITTMTSLENGTIWTGGKDGLVVIWNALKRCPLREFRHSRPSSSSGLSSAGYHHHHHPTSSTAYVSSITTMVRTETRKIWCTFSDGTLQVWTVECPYGSGQQRDLVESALDIHVIDSQFTTNAHNTPNRQRSPQNSTSVLVIDHQNQQNDSQLVSDQQQNTENNNSSILEAADPVLARLEKKLKFSESVIRSCRAAMKATEEEREQERRRTVEVEAKLHEALDRLEKLTMIRSSSSSPPSRLQQQQHQQQQQQHSQEVSSALGSPIQKVSDQESSSSSSSLDRTRSPQQQQQQQQQEERNQSHSHSHSHLHQQQHNVSELAAAVQLAQRQSEENDRLQNELLLLRQELDMVKKEKGLTAIDHFKQSNEELKNQVQSLQDHIASAETKNEELSQEVQILREQHQQQNSQLAFAQQQQQQQRSTSALSQRPSAELTMNQQPSGRNSVSNADENTILSDTIAEPEANTRDQLPREVLEEKLRMAEREIEDMKQKEQEQQKELVEAQKLIELNSVELSRLENENKILQENNNDNKKEVTSTNSSIVFTTTENQHVQAVQETAEGSSQIHQSPASVNTELQVNTTSTTNNENNNEQTMKESVEVQHSPSQADAQTGASRSASENKSKSLLSPRQEADLQLQNSTLQNKIQELSSQNETLQTKLSDTIEQSSLHCAELHSLRRTLGKFKEEQVERGELFETSRKRVEMSIEAMRQKLIETEERRLIEEQRAFDAEASLEHELARNSEMQTKLQSKQLELDLALSSLRAFGKDLNDMNFSHNNNKNKNSNNKSSSSPKKTTISDLPFDSPDRSSRSLNTSNVSDDHHSGMVHSASYHPHQVHSSHNNNNNLLLPHISTSDVPQHVLAAQIVQLKKSIHSVTAANDSRQQLLNELNLRHSQDSRTIDRLRSRNEKLVSLLQRNLLIIGGDGEENNGTGTGGNDEIEAQRIRQDEEAMEDFSLKVEELESQREKLQVALQHSIETQRSLSRELSDVKNKVLAKFSSSTINDENQRQLELVKELIGISESKQKVISEQQDIIAENTRFTQLLNSRGFTAATTATTTHENENAVISEVEQDQIIEEVSARLGGAVGPEIEEEEQQINRPSSRTPSVLTTRTSHNNSPSSQATSMMLIPPREDYIQLKTALESLLILVETAFKAEHDLRRIQQLTEQVDNNNNNEEQEEAQDIDDENHLQEKINALIQQNENEEKIKNEGRRKDEVVAAGTPPRIRSISPRSRFFGTNKKNPTKKQSQEEREREKKLLSLLRKNKLRLPPASEGSFVDRIKQSSEALTLHLSHIAHIDETIISVMRELYEVSTTEAISSEMLSLHVPKSVLKNRIQQQQQQDSSSSLENKISDKSLVDILSNKRGNTAITDDEYNNYDYNAAAEEEFDNYKHTPTFAAHAWEHCLTGCVERAVDRLRLQRLAFDGALRRTQSLKERVLLLSSESKNSTDILERNAAALQEKQQDSLREWHEKRRSELVWSVWDTFSGVRTGLQRLSQHTAKLQAQLPREWRGLQMANDVNEVIAAFSISFNRSQYILAECLTDDEKEELEKNGRARVTSLFHQHQQHNGQNQHSGGGMIDYFSPRGGSSSTTANNYQQQQQQQQQHDSISVGVTPVRRSGSHQQVISPSSFTGTTPRNEIGNAFVRSSPAGNNVVSRTNTSMNEQPSLNSTLSPRASLDVVPSAAVERK